MSQILDLDHLEYLVSFIRTKLDKLDSITKEQDTGEPTIEEQIGGSSIEVVTSGGSSVLPYLGAPEKDEKPLLDLTGITKFLVPNFPHILEGFLNKLHTQEEGYYRVQKEHKVGILISHTPVNS